jgi:hypothetical protein
VRLTRVANGQRLPNRVVLRLFKTFARAEPPDVMKLLTYRPPFFGRPYGDLLHDVMRGPSPWSAGERELFAAFTSRLNQCPF